MTLDEMVSKLSLDESFKYRLAPQWNDAVEGWDGKPPYFLNKDYFEKYIAYCNSPIPVSKLMPRVEAVIAAAEKEPALSLFAYLLHRGAFVLQKPFFPNTSGDVKIPLLGENTGMLALMISLGVYPQIKKAYAEVGVPERYALAMMPWLGGTMDSYMKAHHGIPGRPMVFDWLRKYIDKTLFRIGRLEYLMHPYIDWLSAIYRNSKNELRVLCRDWDFREDGYRAGAQDEVKYHTRLVLEKNKVTGTPVFPDGMPDFGHEITLDLNEWKPIANPWDLCPSMHIPGGEKMPFAEVKKSMQMAVEFFRVYFHTEIPLVCCCSWILTPIWEELYEHSNMAEFRKQCYAVPAISWGNKGGMFFLYGRDDVSPLDLPAVNTAQKVYQKAYVMNKCGAGALFVPADEIENLGDMYFRRKYGPPQTNPTDTIQ